MQKKNQEHTKDRESKKEKRELHPMKKRWRILAATLAAALLISELVMHYTPDAPASAMRALDPGRLVAPEVAEILENPMEVLDAVRNARYQQKHLIKVANEAQNSIVSGDYEAAIPKIEELIENMELTEEERTQLEMTKTALYFSCEKFEEAEAGCSALIGQGGSDLGLYYFMRSVCRMQYGSYRESKEDLLKALEHNYEEEATCYVHLAFCENYLEEYDQMLLHANTAIEKGADEVYYLTLVYLQAVASLKLERFEESVGYINTLLDSEEYKEAGDLFYYRGVCFLAREEYQKAYDDFNSALSYGIADEDGGESVLYYNRGVAALGLNKVNEAVADLEFVAKKGTNAELKAAAEEILQMIDNYSETEMAEA